MNRATGPWTSPLPPADVNPVLTMYTKFEMEGQFKPQPFIAYGALFAAPTRDDALVSSRRDYTYAVSSRAFISLLYVCQIHDDLSVSCLTGCTGYPKEPVHQKKLAGVASQAALT